MLKAYNNNFKELIKEGYVRASTSEDMEIEWQNVWYISMSLVVNQNKDPIKTCNVYDTSARYQNTSLNENLLMGPNLLVDILSPLMKMRVNKYAITADVKSMFHRIRIYK
jgi:CRISPR/Cas system endoribonuclease Cas6 (RAMP superfamily)